MWMWGKLRIDDGKAVNVVINEAQCHCQEGERFPPLCHNENRFWSKHNRRKFISFYDVEKVNFSFIACGMPRSARKAKVRKLFRAVAEAPQNGPTHFPLVSRESQPQFVLCGSEGGEKLKKNFYLCVSPAFKRELPCSFFNRICLHANKSLLPFLPPSSNLLSQVYP